MKQTNLEKVFQDARVVTLAGNKHTGKTNNVVHLIKEQRKATPNLNICVFGFAPSVMHYLVNDLNCIEISDLRHMVDKKDTLFILDEFQKLKLNDRREKDTRDKVIDFIYHNNNLLLLSSPNIREFNSIIGGITEKWLIKSINLDQCVNGSQLKTIVMNYKGSRKKINDIRTKKNELILINNNKEEVIYCDYVEEADNKKENKSILSSPKKSKKSQEIVLTLSEVLDK